MIKYVHIIVVTQARVHCLICKHDARGSAAPEGKCGACVATNMYHFRNTSGTINIEAKAILVITVDEEDTLWGKKILDFDTPKGLLQAVFFIMGRTCD